MTRVILSIHTQEQLEIDQNYSLSKEFSLLFIIIIIIDILALGGLD